VWSLLNLKRHFKARFMRDLPGKMREENAVSREERPSFRQGVQKGTAFQPRKGLFCSSEKQRTDPETDIIRAMSYMWCSH
jgi:hypothetical protein